MWLVLASFVFATLLVLHRHDSAWSRYDPSRASKEAVGILFADSKDTTRSDLASSASTKSYFNSQPLHSPYEVRGSDWRGSWRDLSIDHCSVSEKHAHTKSWNLAMALRLNASDSSPSALTPSGPGSSVGATAELRSFLRGRFDDLHIRKFLDVPCGDMTWEQHLDLAGVEYLGGDISPDLVQRASLISRHLSGN